MNKFFLLSTLLFFSLGLSAQAQDKKNEKEVIAVIKQLFDGMRANDSIKIKAVFHKSARLQSVGRDQANNVRIGTTPIQTFISAVGKPSEVLLDERISDYQVRIDGDMATVWTPYQFYLGEKFSHCGVNAFHLFRSDSGWKITQITDTRRKENCLD